MSRRSKQHSLDIRRELSEAGLRVTPARVAVLAAVRDADGPLTHADVSDLLKRKSWDKATVFRNLVTLSDAGFLRRTDLGDHVWRFEAVEEELERGVLDEHPHFLCTDCGLVECIPGLELNVRGSRDVPRAVRRRAVEVQLKGLCDTCSG